MGQFALTDHAGGRKHKEHVKNVKEFFKIPSKSLSSACAIVRIFFALNFLLVVHIIEWGTKQKILAKFFLPKLQIKL